jgi:formylglycine-generating enzyme required for sulfatase activity
VTIQTHLELIQTEQVLQDSMLLIPGGSYQMGSSNDPNFKRAGHPETIKSFYLVSIFQQRA